MSFPADAAEGTLRALIQASPLPITALDPDGVVLVWNSAAERVFGWTADEIVGRSVPLVPEGGEEEHRALRERTLAGEAIAGVEVHGCFCSERGKKTRHKRESPPSRKATDGRRGIYRNL